MAESTPYSNGRSESTFKNAILYKNNNILIATKSNILSFNTLNKTLKTEQFTDNAYPPFLRDIHLDGHNNLWLATDEGIYKKTKKLNTWQKFKAQQINTTVKSISSSHQNVWFASAMNGLFQYNLNTQSLSTHQANNAQNGLDTNELSLVFTDKNQTIWLTTFANKIYSSTDHYRGKSVDYGCGQSVAFYDFIERDKHLFLAAQNGLVIFNQINKTCQFIQTDQYTHSDSIYLAPQAINVDSENNIWLGGRNGLVQINSKSGQFEIQKNKILHSIKGIRFITPFDSNRLLIGGDYGLYIFNNLNHSFAQVDKPGFTPNTQYIDYVTLDKHTFIASNRGIHTFDHNSYQVSTTNDLAFKTNNKDISNLAYFDDTLYFSIKNKGLFKYILSKGVISPIDIPQSVYLMYDLLIDPVGILWIPSNIGVIRFDLNETKTHVFGRQYGFLDQSFIPRSSYRDTHGLIHFGTRNGLTRFDPQKLSIDSDFPPLGFTELLRFNNPIKPNKLYDGFKVPININDLSELQLTHKDLVIGFQFKVLDLFNSSQYRYAYKLNGFDPDWNYTNSQSPQITYTNLPSGDYQLYIKAQTFNNEWLSDVRSLDIKVLPAPWLSWWAFTTYFLLVAILIFVYVRLKIRASKILAKQLSTEVTNKTRTLNQQKETIEQLLDRKNELFSQVSHEFRTPLTLIIGPLNNILQENPFHKNRTELEMIARNAKRLLSLVEQLLSLAKVSAIDEPKRRNQNTKVQIEAVIESFQYLAKQNNISLKLVDNEPAQIKATEQCLDGILGNLVSNAIKYSKPNSGVIVSARIKNDLLIIKVKDSGPGLKQEEQSDIFQHFMRLPQHLNIDGLGIGLSVVDELVKANHGQLHINSEMGDGSEFIIKLPIASNETLTTNEPGSQSSLIKQLAQPGGCSTYNMNDGHALSNASDTKNSLLVIEDNHDMRTHLHRILSKSYNCHLAANGKEGVRLAIEHIPDMIICDVMMPLMDGYKVSRIIRSDERTCHIPLMLLTALNDKKSRIKGWREHIDCYMTKPFDRDELLIQIENVLTIRDILKRKNGQNLTQSKLQNCTLTKKDKQFVEKLQTIYQQNFHDTLLTKAKIAQLMAVSERQLQRKLKAITDQNPMEMLREFRLKKSCELLKDGYQIGQVSDQCGFNSPSYFSQCFKAHYGTSPKTYQITTTN